jgi:15-cis-phytoene synthase
VLVTIYHRLLSRIAAHKMDVFSERVSVPTSSKIAILARGALMAAWNRVLG